MKKYGMIYLVVTLFVVIGTMNVNADELKSKEPLKTSPRIQEGNMKDSISPKVEDKKSEQAQPVDKDYKDIEDKIVQSEKDYNNQKEIFKTRIRAIYSNSNANYLQNLLTSRSIIEFYNKMQVISIIVKKDASVLNEIEMTKQEYALGKKLKEDLNGNKSAGLVSVAMQSSESELKKRENVLKLFDDNENLLIKEAEDVGVEINSLQDHESSYAGGNMTWPCPVSSKISSYYGMRLHPVLRINKLHTGVDITASYGSSIVAANAGKVILAKYTNGYGRTTVIDHGGGVATLYGHQSAISVKVGQVVSLGQQIGKVGSTGWSTGNHLHFEVRLKGGLLDPIGYITFGV